MNIVAYAALLIAALVVVAGVAFTVGYALGRIDRAIDRFGRN
jgi:hypothetical protein